MSKLKKFLLLIPTAFIMLLNYMSFTAFADEINYQDYWIDLSEIPELQSREWIFDSTKDSDNPGFSKYIYAVYTEKSSYDDFISGKDDEFAFNSYYIDLTNVEFESNEYSVISLNRVPIQQIIFEFRSDGIVYSHSAVTNSYFIRYFPDSGTIQLAPIFDSSGYPLADESYIDKTSYYIHIESNHPDFPVPDFAGGSSGGALNVDVVFNPALSDTLDRSMISDDGSNYLRSNFSMHVYNHNKFPIQYTMVISSALLDVDNVFCYYSNDWVYSRSLDSYDDFYNDVVQKQQKSTFAHYVLSGRTDSVNFNFNQINLVEGGIYTVRVYAGRNDCGYGSEFVLSVDDYASESYQINYSLVYESTFSVLQYDDVKYDPNNTSNGILPYNYGLSQKYNHSYNAVEKQDGEVDYTGKDVYSDNDSWYNHPIDDNSVSSSTSGTTSFSNFSKSFKNFFGFIKYMFNFLPKDVKTVFTLGFTGIMVIALVKVLFKS